MGNEYLNSSLLPTIPPLSEIPSPLNGTMKDSLPPLPSHNSQSDMSKSGFTLSAAPSVKRTSSSGLVFRPSNLHAQPARKRLSSIGVASSHARLFKVLGDLFLLSGRPEDALVWCVHQHVKIFDISNIQLSIGIQKPFSYSNHHKTLPGTRLPWKELLQFP
jgi:hypothetical protein